ncbi:MAG: hypothetical protein KDJ29_19875, partial [Hyphomicrobiales bacterium]|nr:hypothetical protein [Hyphomicrobiales bacterium]
MFEGFETQLITTTGSEAKAKKAMAWVTNFAKDTVFSLDKVTAAYVRLQAYGIDPTNGSLATLGDTSAALNYPLMKAVEAIADAAMGENERLKEFQVKASKNKKTGNFEYKYQNKAGKWVTAFAKANDPKAIQTTLLKIWQEKFEGGNKRQAKTWLGLTNNLGDAWQRFQLAIMQTSGLFSWMKKKLEDIYETILKYEENGTFAAFAKQIGDAIKHALKQLWAFGKWLWASWPKFKQWLTGMKDMVGGWKNLAMIVTGIVFSPMLISMAAGLTQIAIGLSMIGTALAANPIVLALMAIAGAAALIYYKWGMVKKIFSNLSTGQKFAALAVAIGIVTAAVWALSAALWANPIVLVIAAIAGGAALIIANWAKVKAFFSGLWTGIVSRATAAWNYLKSLFAWAPGKVLAIAWAGLKVVAQSAMDGVKAIVASGWRFVMAVLTAPVRLAKWVLSGLDWSLVKSGWEAAKGLVSKAVTGAKWTLGGLATSAVTNSWNGLKTLVQTPVTIAKWVLPKLDTADAKVAREAIRKIFEAPMKFAKWALPGLDISAVTQAWANVKAIFNWSPIEAIKRNFGKIGGVIASAIGNAAAAAGRGFARLKTIFSRDTTVNIAARDPASIANAAKAADRLKGALEGARSVDMSGVSTKINALKTQAGSLKTAVSAGVSAAQSYLASQSFHRHGVRLMETLAAGIRGRAKTVVNAIKATMQQVRNHLPSSPAKTGPLSDIHRLKFAETIAASIRPAPMVRAMRIAAAAAMAAATPVLTTPDSAIAATRGAASRLPVSAVAEAQPRAPLGAPAGRNGPGAGAGSRPGRDVTITYSPTVNLPAG